MALTWLLWDSNPSLKWGECIVRIPLHEMSLITFVTGEVRRAERWHWIGTDPTSHCNLTLTFCITSPFKYTCTSSLSTNSETILQLNCIVHCIFRIFSVSFTAPLTHYSFMSWLSPAASPIRLSSHAPSHLSSPTLYPLTNTRPLPATLSSLLDILTLTKQTSPSHSSLSNSHHPTAWFLFQTTD